jgi:glycolate oxidase FAD binding subunit
MTVFQPSDARETQQVIAWAAAEGQALDISAGGTKRGLGRPPQAAHAIDLSQLTGIMDYDHAELVLTARAATPMADITRELTAHHQMLAFEPPDWRGLLGSGGEPTLGGTLACNLSGPRRVRAGAARDHLLGFLAINGRAEAWKAGGRVVKNVTGYDMCKLQAGAFGTLSVLTELSVRVVPKPETSCGLLLHGLSDAAGVAAMAQALNSQHEVSAAAHLPERIARRSGLGEVSGACGSVTALRLEGHGPSVDFRRTALAALFDRVSFLDHAATESVWTEIASVSALLKPAGRSVWRICTAPSSAPAVLDSISARLPSAEAFYDWGGGLLWISLDTDEAGPDAGAATLRAATRTTGGHATLIVAAETTRATAEVFEPEQTALAALTRRVKDGFDPRHILNPGRLRQGE